MQPPGFILSPESIDGSAADDHAISRALLDRVAAREIAAALRIWRPVPTLALTRIDELHAGATDAIAAANHMGLPTVVRMSGGHAVVLGTGSLCVGLAEPASTFEGIGERYERFCDAVAAALTDVGITVERSALDGEWCPGAWSLCSGQVKLAGLAQRAIKGAAWIEAVIELATDPRARQLLADVYDALGLPLDVTTVGSLADVLGAPVAFEDLAGLLADRLQQ